MIVVRIEAAQRRRALRTLRLSVAETIFSAGPGLQAEPAVGPQLPLGAKTMRRLNQRNEECNPDRAQSRNLAQQLIGCMFVALREQLPAHVATNRQQAVELGVQLLSAAPHAGFRQLF